MKLIFRHWSAIAMFILFGIITYSLEAVPFILPQLPRTELTGQDTKKTDQLKIETYTYRSQLSRDKIKQSYRGQLISSGWELKFENEGSLMFMRGKLGENIILDFAIPLDTENQTINYSFKVTTCYRLPILPWTNFKAPQELDFMPVYLEATQFQYNTIFPPMIGVGYLSHKPDDAITRFYLENMPEFGWTLVSNNHQAGRYKFSQWLLMVDPFTKVLAELSARGYDELAPLLEVSGNTLSFAQEGKTCTITVHRFPDIISASKKTIFDASDIEKYGETLVAVFYFDRKK